MTTKIGDTVFHDGRIWAVKALRIEGDDDLVYDLIDDGGDEETVDADDFERQGGRS